MTVAKPTITCPFCKEPIIAGATRCKHCQSDLSKGDAPKGKSPLTKYNTFRVGFLVGILFTIIMVILAYLQFKQD